MVHLPALPGTPKSDSTLDACVDHAVRDALSLEAGGVDGLIIENFNDVPFRAGRVDPHTVAAMTRIGLAVRETVSVPIGINVLRNDAVSALGIAAAIDAQFIRVNVHVGTMATDQGLITGEADQTLRLRRELGHEDIKIVADVLVKHALPLGPLSIEQAVEDATQRGLADAIVVSGVGTGKPALPDDVRLAASVAGRIPIYIGSGVDPDGVMNLVPPAYGVIVGSWLKMGADVSRPVDSDRVRRVREALDAALNSVANG